MFYAYVHARPNTIDAGGIFYVGKGKDRRAFEVGRDNRYHRNIVKKYGEDNILIGRIACSTEKIAFDLERGLIKCLRRQGVQLANLTNGGEGPSGYIPTEETRQKISKANKGRVGTFTGLKHTQEAKFKVSKANKGRKAWNVGTKMSNDARQKMSVAHSGVSLASEHVANIAKANRGKKRTGAALERIRAGFKYGADHPQFGKQLTVETKNKLSAFFSKSIWLNNGIKNTRVAEDKCAEMLLNGWKRGRV